MKSSSPGSFGLRSLPDELQKPGNSLPPPPTANGSCIHISYIRLPVIIIGEHFIIERDTFVYK